MLSQLVALAQKPQEATVAPTCPRCGTEPRVRRKNGTYQDYCKGCARDKMAESRARKKQNE